ncbi:NHLP leader peptide family RiPP precursor [Nostoc favosum]|uniref:NHLP leader peptide family RiPP n=1 Tax=Nostoc favosum CHAB5714 TaxID=2780399 RepID=A0ABS8IBN7_9NOSO|nr:NHLP leader peptide family RiPP precursor [Nostoc favosum]MCC5601584.1 NHLP leader peptide family RiPP precursor [Nostoc favosum CHAB5714]
MHEELKKIISDATNARFEFEQKVIQRAWEDETFKQELLSNPKAVFARESGQELPKDIEIEVLQETANKVYLVLPNNPALAGSEEELSEEALEAVAGGASGCIKSSRHKGSICLAWSAVSNANDKV